ncbi:MAG: sulfotransferase [Thermodesulfovibrionales bacterium]|nr:sulfotransferase [Thermodesulfovibrionales bacterium]
MDRRLILIVGVQKSGTSLLFRMLQETGLVTNPFQNEGHEFWGNIPHFSPSEFPAGTIYQQTGGEMGHEIGAGDATEEVLRDLTGKLSKVETDSPVIANKNPYNSVRLPWLKGLFPDSLVIAVTRNAAPNIFSLTKKYIPHKGRGKEPDDGWWGVKPKGWRKMVSEDKTVQSAKQWEAVNRKILEDREHVDMFLSYRRLCEEPEAVVREVLDAAYRKQVEVELHIPPLTCLDSEFTRGSQLKSKNRLYKKLGSFEIPEGEKVEHRPFTDEQLEKIESICRETEASIMEATS